MLVHPTIYVKLQKCPSLKNFKIVSLLSLFSPTPYAVGAPPSPLFSLPLLAPSTPAVGVSDCCCHSSS